MSLFAKKSSSAQRREAALIRQRADSALRAAKQADRSSRKQIEQGLAHAAAHPTLPQLKAGLCAWTSTLTRGREDREQHERGIRQVLLHVADVAPKLLETCAYVQALGRLGRLRKQWVRQPEPWRPRTHNAGRQFSSLARHLLAQYPVPSVFDAAFFVGVTCGGVDREAAWFIHIGRGNNLRTAAGLPFPLTKMMAHHALAAPDDVVGGIFPALRWGQVRGCGGTERLAGAIVASRLGQPVEDERFWLTVIQFFVANPMFDPHQVGPIVDFLHNQRFVEAPGRIVDGVYVAGAIPQPNLTMRRRTIESLLRQLAQWHRELARDGVGGAAGAAGRDAPATWPSSGIAGYERVEGTPGNQRIFRVVELLDVAALREEGRVMRHCVASYAASCARGRCAIFSLREDDGSTGGGGRAWRDQRRLTIEVIVQNRRIVQARGRYNKPPEGVDDRVLRAWATTAGLTIAPTNRL